MWSSAWSTSRALRVAPLRRFAVRGLGSMQALRPPRSRFLRPRREEELARANGDESFLQATGQRHLGILGADRAAPAKAPVPVLESAATTSMVGSLELPPPPQLPTSSSPAEPAAPAMASAPVSVSAATSAMIGGLELPPPPPLPTPSSPSTPAASKAERAAPTVASAPVAEQAASTASSASFEIPLPPPLPTPSATSRAPTTTTQEPAAWPPVPPLPPLPELPPLEQTSSNAQSLAREEPRIATKVQASTASGMPVGIPPPPLAPPPAEAVSTSSSAPAALDMPGPPPLEQNLPGPPSMPLPPSPTKLPPQPVARSSQRQKPARMTGPAPEAKAALRNRPLTAQEQYEKLKHFLPMTKDPNTPRPKPEELSVGTRLRVEWSNAWWAAKVKDVDEERVKIGFETWSSNYDEWIPRDSTRFRLPAADDVEVEANPVARAGLERRSGFPAPEDVPIMSGRQRPFVPKPYNPEKEFQKRQLRLREKIANMQRSKLGDVDSSLESLKSLQASRFPFADAEKPTSSTTMPNPPGNPTPARAGVAAAESLTPPAIKAPVAASPPDTTVAPPVLQQAKAEAVAKPADVSKIVKPSADVAKIAEQPADDGIWVEEKTPAAKEALPADVAETPKVDMAVKQADDQPSTGAVISWEEVVSDSNERYYHEFATGRTQWELPTQGWVELISDDGSRYYWEPEKNITQWTKP